MWVTEKMPGSSVEFIGFVAERQSGRRDILGNFYEKNQLVAKAMRGRCNPKWTLCGLTQVPPACDRPSGPPPSRVPGAMQISGLRAHCQRDLQHEVSKEYCKRSMIPASTLPLFLNGGGKSPGISLPSTEQS